VPGVGGPAPPFGSTLRHATIADCAVGWSSGQRLPAQRPASSGKHGTWQTTRDCRRLVGRTLQRPSRVRQGVHKGPAKWPFMLPRPPIGRCGAPRTCPPKTCPQANGDGEFVGCVSPPQELVSRDARRSVARHLRACVGSRTGVGERRRPSTVEAGRDASTAGAGTSPCPWREEACDRVAERPSCEGRCAGDPREERESPATACASRLVCARPASIVGWLVSRRGGQRAVPPRRAGFGASGTSVVQVALSLGGKFDPGRSLDQRHGSARAVSPPKNRDPACTGSPRCGTTSG
jgi:hypothetical protein